MPDEDELEAAADLEGDEGGADDDAPITVHEIREELLGKGESESQAIAHLPGYTKLLQDQQLVLKWLLIGFDTRDDLYEWVLSLYAHGLGRRPQYARALVNERLIPFLVKADLGDTDEGLAIRQDLALFLIEEFFAPAQAQFSRKAQEQRAVKVEYLREAKQRSAWDAVARRGGP